MFNSAIPDGTDRHRWYHLPSIRDHEYVAAHLDVEDFRKWYTMTNVSSVPVKHDHRRPSSRELRTMAHQYTLLDINEECI